MRFLSVRARLLLPCLWLSLSLAACSTVQVNNAEGAAKAGQAYAATVRQVNELAFDSSLNFTAHLLPSLPRNTEVLKQQTAQMRQRRHLIDQVNRQLESLAAYFDALDALSKGDTSVVTGRALGRAASSLNVASIQTGDSFGRLVSLGHHSQRMAHVLKRDADAVARTLEHFQAIVHMELEWVRFYEQADRIQDFEKNVAAPFVGGKKLSATWQKAWVRSIQTPDLEVVLNQTERATADMLDAWKAVLRGDDDIAARFDRVQVQLSEVNRQLKTLD